MKLVTSPGYAGELPEFDNSENGIDLKPENRSKVSGKEKSRERRGKFVSYERGVQVPSKYSVAQAAGYIKGKSAMYITRTYGGRDRNFRGENLGARGYCVSTAGKDEELVSAYIREQEDGDKKATGCDFGIRAL
jgi:hypothetical protein